MASAWLTNFSQQYGLDCSPTGNVFGNVGGYFVSIFEQGNFINISLSYFADMTEQDKVNKINFKLKDDTNLATLSGKGITSINGVNIKLPNNEQSQSELYSILADYTKFFAEIGLTAKKKVPLHQPPLPTPEQMLKVQYGVKHNTRRNYPIAPIPKSYDDTYNSGMSSVFKGLLGAFIGALVGAIPWIVVINLTFDDLWLLALAAFVIPACATYGYKRFGGASNSIITNLIIILSTSVVAISSMAIVYATNIATESGSSFFSAFNILFSALETDSDLRINAIIPPLAAISFLIPTLKER